MTEARFVEVALPLPLFQTYTYSVPAQAPAPPVAGSRVLVPVRGRRVLGIVLGTATGEGVRNLKEYFEAPDTEPAIPAELLALARWIAEYYIAPIGLVLRAMLPSLLSGAAVPRPAPQTQRLARIAVDLPSLAERDTLFARAARQRALYEALEGLGGVSDTAHLQTQLGFSPAVVKALADRGLITFEQSEVQRDPFLSRAIPAAADHEPTAPQREAIAALKGAAPGSAFLLRGITGSGKTLVYIELLKEIVLRRGRSAIVLVPEIALTPQAVDRFRAAFGDRIAVLHSGLSDGERYDAWRALRSGAKTIAVGARSAVFAPLANLGAIIVDEEHEGSYKNGETPRYHARAVALMRARAEGAVVVLGSATPSLESWRNAEAGRFTLLTLPDRVADAKLPTVEVVDMRVTVRPQAQGPRASVIDPFRRVFSEPLEAALGERLQRGEQSILMLNRRGFAAFVQCEACGDVVVCPNCSITLTYHRGPERLVCHYCRHEQPPSGTCAKCGGTTVHERGLGTQQAEKLLVERYPYARIARMDVDTTSGKWAHTEILDRVGRGEVDILLGTQMIAKGLDFPNVTLVGVLDADIGINLPDFRASERSFQLMSQVAGRAGRGTKGGEVIIQTRVPSHHAVRCATTHDFLGFVAEEMEGRRDPVYPPFTHLANLIVSGTEEEPVAKAAIAAVAWLRRLIADQKVEGVTVVGPAPCPIERVKRRWRWHGMLKGENGAAMTKVCSYFLRNYALPAGHDLRVIVDRDPVQVL